MSTTTPTAPPITYASAARSLAFQDAPLPDLLRAAADWIEEHCRIHVSQENLWHVQVDVDSDGEREPVVIVFYADPERQAQLRQRERVGNHRHVPDCPASQGEFRCTCGSPAPPAGVLA